MTARLRGFWAVLGAAIMGLSVVTAPPALAADPFISTWDTTKTSYDSSGDHTIELPLLSTGSYNFSVSWGDGQTETITSSGQGTHTYATAGSKTITITGDLLGWSFLPCATCLYNGDRTKILEVVQWGNLQLGNTGGYFGGAENLTIPATDEPDLTGTTDLSLAFANAKHLTGGLSGWNTSAVTTMSGTFSGASLYNEDISGWQTVNVTRMDSMFLNAAAFNQPIGAWDTTQVTDMHWMFSGASSFDQPLENWNVAKVTDMASMFTGASSFNQAIGSGETGAVTNMSGMFAGASSFNQPLDNWNVAKVADMGRMFDGATAFDQPLAGWNVASVTNMSSMFSGATSFNQPLATWDTSKVTDMSYMFSGAIAFNGTVSSWNTGNVRSMIHTFTGAVAFDQPIGGWDVSKVTSMEGMLAGATDFNQNLGTWNVGQVTDMNNLLNAVNLSVTNYNSLLNGWAALPVLQPGLTLSAGDNRYTSLAAAAHDHLQQMHGWTIQDGGILDSAMDAGPNPTDFGPQNLGFAGQRTVTVASGGPAFADLIFGPNAVSITGADAPMFAIAQDNCSGKTMPPGGDVCTVTVSFSPTSIGDKAAQLRFVSNSPQSPYVVSLIGTGVAPIFTADPPAVDFGQQLIGTPSEPRMVTIGNAGNVSMYIGQYNLAIKGPAPGAFQIATETCRNQRLQPGASCTITLTFTPLAAGTSSAYLEILDDAPGAPHTVTLSGTSSIPPTVSPTPPPPSLASPQNLKVKAKKKSVKASWGAVSNATGYRATLKGKTKKKSVTKTWQGSAKSVKWSVQLKPGSKVKICVVALNPAMPDSPRSCAKSKAPR